MATATIELPEELLALLRRSRLHRVTPAKQVQTALAVHLFQQGLVSVGKAAELCGEPRASFEALLVELGIPAVRYDVADYEEDARGFAAVEGRRDEG